MGEHSLFARGRIDSRHARTKIAKTNMAPIKRQLICSIPVPYVFFFLLTITHAVVGLSRLWEENIRKFEDAKSPGFFRDLRHGCENPTECSACAVEQKIANVWFFDHLDLIGKGRFSTTTRLNLLKFGREILQTAVKWKIKKKIPI